MSSSPRQQTEVAYPQLIDDSQYSSSQEQTPVPVAAGEQIFAVHWITPIYGQHAQEANDIPSKK